MAVIYSYPQKGSVVDGDLFVITDPADSNKTKTVTAQTLADYIDGEVTLQEVLDTGNTANNQSITLTGAPGDITISGDYAGVRASLSNSVVAANVTTSSSSIQSSGALTISNTTGQLTLSGPNQINLTSTNAGIVLTTGGAANDDISLQTGANGDIIGNCNIFNISSKGTIIDANAGNTSIIGDGAISIGDTNTSAINLRSEAGVSITAPTPATADVDSTVVFRGPNGSVDRPTYSFANGNTTGVYMATPDEISIGIGASEVARIVADTIQLDQGVTFPNSTLGSPQTYQKLNNFENGTWTPVLVDGVTEIPNVTYSTQEGVYVIMNNVVYGTFKIVTTAITGVPLPVSGLNIKGNILSGTGAGANLFAQFPVNSAKGSTVTIGNVGTFNGPAGYPVGGFVSATAAQGLVLQTYPIGAAEFRKITAAPTLNNATSIEGSFIYSYLP